MIKSLTVQGFIKTTFCLVAFLLLTITKAQPNVDILNVSSQHFVSNYSDSTKHKLYTQDNFVNIFLPIKFGKGHVFLLRINSEQLTINRSANPTQSYSLYSLSMPIGLQLQSKNEKWKFAGIVIPKINSDFKDNLDYDGQLGGMGIVTRVFSPKLQVRLGAYYNKEFFGDFILPLVGLDWKVNDKFRMYGTLPSNYRFEFKLGKKMYTGIGYRAFQRSYRLENKYADDFIRLRETQLKVFFEGFVVGKILLGVDFYRTIGYNFLRYDYFETKTEVKPTDINKVYNNAFSKSKDGYGITFNLAYRIRTD